MAIPKSNKKSLLKSKAKVRKMASLNSRELRDYVTERGMEFDSMTDAQKRKELEEMIRDLGFDPREFY
tara:strand:+ start:338 stop:541 length:204 start_codon:yes stop_codon:yes gene_type:complete